MMFATSSGRNGGFRKPPINRVTKVEVSPEEGASVVRVSFSYTAAALSGVADTADNNHFLLHLCVRDAADDGDVTGFAEVGTMEVRGVPLPPRGEALLAIPPDGALLDAADAAAQRSTLDRDLRPRTTAVVLCVQVTDAAAPTHCSFTSDTWERELAI